MVIPKYCYDRQAKEESESRDSHLNPNPRTNKQQTWLFRK